MLSKPLMRYLDSDEAYLLKEYLSNEGIESIVKRQGLPRILGGITNFKVLIDPGEVSNAQAALSNFSQEMKLRHSEQQHLLSTQCPACKSGNVTTVEKISMIQRIFYCGVIIMRCKECSSRWYR
ncbi:hypothetical protein QA601_07225 [Chitinispirillales bacterium ANBcel5]|uniref:hypothetical protein n=1 Tax=Cellulosispirillum alkaliphilum TaxID=3039283 RepID=UPI002A51C6AF|nr:hypothetical protein [Chitinispirillales bacterium ANBcel5]